MSSQVLLSGVGMLAMPRVMWSTCSQSPWTRYRTGWLSALPLAFGETEGQGEPVVRDLEGDVDAMSWRGGQVVGGDRLVGRARAGERFALARRRPVRR